MKVELVTEPVVVEEFAEAGLVVGRRYINVTALRSLIQTGESLPAGSEVLYASCGSGRYAIGIKDGVVYAVKGTFTTPPRHLPQPEQMVQITLPLDAAKQFFADAYYRAESDSSAEKLADEIEEALKVL